MGAESEQAKFLTAFLNRFFNTNLDEVREEVGFLREMKVRGRFLRRVEGGVMKVGFLLLILNVFLNTKLSEVMVGMWVFKVK